jgi:RND family efflux transporter MFP subunit
MQLLTLRCQQHRKPANSQILNLWHIAFPWCNRNVDKNGLPMLYKFSRVLPCAERSFLVFLFALPLMACSPGGAQGPGGPGGPPPVSVAPVTQRTVQEFDEFSARLEATDTVDVRSRVAGTLERMHFREGQKVARGDLLFTVDVRPFAAELARTQAQLASARTQAEQSKSEAVRAEKLLPLQAISPQELDQLRAASRNGEASIKAAQAAVQTAQLNVNYARITAPIAGRISRANVSVGNLVSAGDPVLTTIVSMDNVYAYFDASEAAYLKYGRASRASPTASASPVLMGLSNEEGFPHQGKMDFVDNRLNPATGSIRGRAVFDNKEGLFTPGLFARLKLIGSESYPATLVPERAIATDQTRKVVMVVGANNIVEPREVKLGTLIDGMRAVTGVKPGENIIVDGMQRAFPGAPVTPQVLKVDDKGMPIIPPPQQGGPPGAAKEGEKKDALKPAANDAEKK